MEENKQMVENSAFATQSIGKLIMQFAIPSIISLVVNSLYNIVDQIFIGQGVGYLGNAATNVAFPLVTISMSLALLVGDGTAAFFSLKQGEGKKEDAAASVGNAVLLSGILGIVFIIISYLFLHPLLQLFGMTPAVETYAKDYTEIILIGIPFVIMGVATSSIIRADGSPKFSMMSMLVGAIINTVLDPIFILVFHWGVTGAAIATILGQIATCIINICYMHRFKSIDFSWRQVRFRASIMGRQLALGISSFITQMAVTIVIIAVNNSLVAYGAASKYGSEIPLSALGIVMKVNQIAMSVMVGFATGSQPILGFNYGARNYGRVKKTYFISVTLATAWALICFAAFQLIPQSIVNIFGQEDALYNEFAVTSFRTFLMVVFLNGLQIVSSIFFQAIGKPGRAMLVSLSRQLIFFLPALYILPKYLGIMGILYTGPVADGLAFLLTLVCVLIEWRKLTRQEREEEALRAAAQES